MTGTVYVTQKIQKDKNIYKKVYELCNSQEN